MQYLWGVCGDLKTTFYMLLPMLMPHVISIDIRGFYKTEKNHNSISKRRIRKLAFEVHSTSRYIVAMLPLLNYP